MKKTESQDDKVEAEERSSPGAHIVYEAIMMEGEEELSRKNGGLFFSGLSAGLAMGASLLAQGVLHSHLPEAVWRHLVVSLGYTAGFLIVVLGRQQLFTENTLTVMLPLLKWKKMHVLVNMIRLWTVVLVANLLGAWLFAWVISDTETFDEHTKRSLKDVSMRGVMLGGAGTVFIRAIFAGWLIALMVWMLPAAESARFFVVAAVSYLVGVAGLAHIIAGAAEVFYLLHQEAITFGHALFRYLLPTLLGNIVGGVTLVAVLNHAQVAGGK